ncbi:hypothetical protein [Terrabacter sp. NPDC080008]|uniref:hypothetical protein n=1 Tax=Terrabacter sp. NPDC080008 TaxID=3155176 RepID=UPI00344B7DB3
MVSALILSLTACTSWSVSPDAPAPTATTSAVGTASAAAPPTETASTSGGDIDPSQWAAARQSAVADLVRRRLAALEHSDRTGWLAALDGAADDSLRRTQAAVFDRMTRMGAGDFVVTDLEESTPPVPAPRTVPVEWDARASLTYRLRGFDTAPRAFDLDLTFKAGPGAPTRLVVSGWAPSGRPQPWDLDGLVVRRSPSAMVLAVGSPARVDEVAARAATAAARVAAVWGSARPAVWVAPATDADAARLLGRTSADLGEVAAATEGPLTPGQHAGADRIVLVPGAWTSLQPAGRDVVMTHELTHVTVRAATTQAVPLWLSEGFAELVAYAPIDLPEGKIVAPALRHARSAGLPRMFPADADFEPGTASLPSAYGLSLLALRTLADAHGTAAVVRLYQAAAGGLDVRTDRVGDGEAAVDDALQAVLHTDRAAVVRAWQARIARLLR